MCLSGSKSLSFDVWAHFDVTGNYSEVSSAALDFKSLDSHGVVLVSGCLVKFCLVVPLDLPWVRLICDYFWVESICHLTERLLRFVSEPNQF